jgi:hypothetical protein
MRERLTTNHLSCYRKRAPRYSRTYNACSWASVARVRASCRRRAARGRRPPVEMLEVAGGEALKRMAEAGGAVAPCKGL